MSATPKDTMINISSLPISDLKEDYKELGIINQRQEKRVNNLESKAYQLVAFYLIFQGIILTAISQASSLKCHNWWIPFTLSFLVALLIAITFTRTIIKYARTKWQLQLNRLERDKIYMARMSLQGQGRAVCVEDLNQEWLKPDHSKWQKRHIYIALTMITLFSFTLLMLSACRSILCDE